MAGKIVFVVLLAGVIQNTFTQMLGFGNPINTLGHGVINGFNNYQNGMNLVDKSGPAVGYGDVDVAGNLPVGGEMTVNGNLPVIGYVNFEGNIPATGSVTVASNKQT